MRNFNLPIERQTTADYSNQASKRVFEIEGPQTQGRNWAVLSNRASSGEKPKNMLQALNAEVDVCLQTQLKPMYIRHDRRKSRNKVPVHFSY